MWVCVFVCVHRLGEEYVCGWVGVLCMYVCVCVCV